MRAIACMDMNSGIGYNNDLLYRIDKDMNFFKGITSDNGYIVMGHNTFKSIKSKPLKGRVNIVICSDKILLYDITGKMNVWKDVKYDALPALFPNSIVIGGEQIYKLFEPYIDYIYLTEVLDDNKKADTFFPLLDKLKTMAYLNFVETIATDTIPAIKMGIYMDKVKYKDQIQEAIDSGEFVENMGVK